MIKMVADKLQQGLNLLEITRTCPRSHNCLWLARPRLFQMPDILPRGCPRENCEVIIFRTTLESSSPAFYAECLRLSQFDSILSTTTAIVTSGRRGNRGRKLKGVSRHIYDLRTFGEIIALTIYPLFLETKEIPFLSFKEIAELKNDYRETETIEKMREINAEWLSWIESITQDLVSDQTYPSAAIYLAHLFLKGLEKTQLPDFKTMSGQDKEKFFREIEKGLSVNGQTD